MLQGASGYTLSTAARSEESRRPELLDHQASIREDLNEH